MASVNNEARPAAGAPARRSVCLLSLDGGGIRGISSIVILKEIMRLVNHGKPAEEHLQPWQVFDLIGGTSTGGIIAVMMGCLRMTLDECETAYMTLVEKIFKPKRSRMNPLRVVDFYQASERFDSQSMERVLKDIIREKTGSPCTGLRNPEMDEAPCRVFVTTVRADNQELCLLRSYDNPYQPSSDFSEWQAWEALRATSAANTYFKGHRHGDLVYLDGALKGNNPVYQVMMEADELWDDPEAVMVSIGTGEKIPAPIQGNLVKLARTLTKTLINPRDTDQFFRRDYKLMADKDLIYRFSVPRLGHVKLEDYKSIPFVKTTTELFMREASMMDYLMRCREKVEQVLNTAPMALKVSDLASEEKIDCSESLRASEGGNNGQRIAIDKPVPATRE